jgi:hypothetical protein
MAESIPGAQEWILEQARAAASERAGGREPDAVGAGVDAAVGNDGKSLNDILNYRPFPKQCRFHASPAKYQLFGGSAGPGKSKALLMDAVVQALETPEGCAAEFVRGIS